MELKGAKIDFLGFFKPTKRLRHYLILEAIAANAQVTQREIGEVAGISPAVVNQYLAEFERAGLIRKRKRSQRDCIYLLTREGQRQRLEMMVNYIRETFKLFSTGKDQLAEILQNHARKHGLKRVIFYSAGEVTELLLHALGATEIELLAIVDDDPAKQGREFFGYPVISREQIEDYKPDAVIVTTFRYRDGIIKRIRHLQDRGIRVLGL